MDQLVFAKSNAFADAFTHLLSIHVSATPDHQSRVWSRRMICADELFMQYSYREPDQSGSTRARMQAIRYLSVHFVQTDGYAALYPHSAQEMQPYLPNWGGTNPGFNFEKFYKQEAERAHIFTLDEIDYATASATQWLLDAHPLPTKGAHGLQMAIEYITQFKRKHGSPGPIRLTTEALDSLINH